MYRVNKYGNMQELFLEMTEGYKPEFFNSTKSRRVYRNSATGEIRLYSYNTLVCAVDKEGYLSCSGLYSATTRRHISDFCRKYTNISYYDIKESVGKYVLNIRTGEKKAA